MSKQLGHPARARNSLPTRLPAWLPRFAGPSLIGTDVRSRLFGAALACSGLWVAAAWALGWL